MKESTVKINLTMNDKASDKLQGFKDVLKGLDTAVINSGKEISKLAGLFTRLKDNAKTAVGDINGLQKAIQGLNTSARTAASNIEQLGNKSQKAGTELKSLETNSNALVGLFSRLGFAVDKLVIDMTALRTAAHGVGGQLNNVLNQANNTSGLANHSRHVQQLAQDYNNMSRAMVGAVQMWAANKIGSEFKEMGKAGFTEEQQQIRMKNAGLTEQERSGVNQITKNLAASSHGNNFTSAELRSIVTDMFLENGDIKNVQQMSGTWVDMLSVMKSNAEANGKTFNIGDYTKLAKSADMKAAFNSPDQLQKFADVLVQASNTLGPESISPENVRQLIQYMKTSKGAVNEDGLRVLLAASDKMRSSTVGLSMDGLVKKGLGVGIQKSEMEALAESGLVDSMQGLQFKDNGELDLAKSKKQFKIKGIEIMQKNVKQWVDEVLVPAMEMDNIDVKDATQRRQWLSRRFANSNQAALLDDLIGNKDAYDRDVKNQQKAKRTQESKEIIDQSSVAAFNNMVKAGKDLYETFGVLLEPVIRKVSNAIAGLLDYLNQFAQSNPAVAKFALLGTAILGISAAIGALLTWFGGLTSVAAALGVTVGGTATAFTMFRGVVAAIAGSLAGFVTLVTGVYTAIQSLGVVVEFIAGTFTGGFAQIGAAIGTITAGVAIFAAGLASMGSVASLSLMAIVKGFLRAFGLVGIILMLAEPIANFKVGGTKLIEWAFIIADAIVDAFDRAFSAIGSAASRLGSDIQRNVAGRLSSLTGSMANGLETIGASDMAASLRKFSSGFAMDAAYFDKKGDKQQHEYLADYRSRSGERKARVNAVLSVNEANEKVDETKVAGIKTGLESDFNNIKAKADAEIAKQKQESERIRKELEDNKKTYENMKNKNGTGTGGSGKKYNADADQAYNQFKEMEGKMKQELETLDSQLKNGVINYQEYAQRKKDIIVKGINEEIEALQKERKAFEDAGNLKGVNRIDRLIEIKKSELSNRLKQLEAEESGKSIKAKQFELEIDQKIGEITGNRRAASIAKLDEEISKLREKAALEGAGPEVTAKIDKYESMARSKIEYEDLMQSVKRFGDTSDLAHKKASSAAKLGEITATEAARRSEDAYRAEGEAIQALIPKLEELAQKTANPDMIKQIEELKIKSHELANQVGEDAKKMKSDVSGAFEGLFNDLSSGKGIKAALNNFAKNIVDTINKTLSKQMSETITNMLFGQEKGGSFTGGMGNFLQGIISPKGFNGGGAGGLGGLFGNLFGGSSSSDQSGDGQEMTGLGKAASMAMNALTGFTTNGVQGSTVALGENIAKTMIGTSTEMTATAALAQLATAAQTAAAALSSIGGGSGGGGLLGNLFGGGSPASSSGGGFFESIGSAVGGIFGGFPSYDVGTDFVPKDMYALIHQGEAILPATAAEKFRQFVDGGGMNSQSAGPTIVNNNFTVNGSTTLQSQQQIAKLAADTLNRAARRNG